MEELEILDILSASRVSKVEQKEESNSIVKFYECHGKPIDEWGLALCKIGVEVDGVDLILGSHPATIQPMEICKNSDGENAFVSYSVGNYISASEYENSNIEMILEIKIKKDSKTGKVTLNKVTYTPVYLLDNGKNAENRYELYDIKDVISKYESGQTDVVDKKLYDKLKQALKEIEKLVGKEE